MTTFKVDDSQTVDFQPAPVGLHEAFCTRVFDLGLQPSQWGFQHKIYLGFQIDVKNPDNDDFFLIGQYFRASMHKKSHFRPFLESWRGVPFKDGDGVSLETLAEKPCMLNVIHRDVPQQDGSLKTYANIDAIMPPTKGFTGFAHEDAIVCTRDLKQNITAMSDYWDGLIASGWQEQDRQAKAKAQEANTYATQKAKIDQGNTQEAFDDEIPF